MSLREPAEDPTADLGEPRVERVAQGLGDRARVELVRLLEEEWRSRAEAFDGMADLASRANAPLARLVEADAEAKAAWLELKRRKIARLEAAVARLSPVRGGTIPPTLVPALHPGLNIFAPAYDFQVTGPTKGQVQSTADRIAGTCEVNLHWGYGGARFATAGVGLALSAGVQGVAHIRPAWGYDFQAIISSSMLSAHTDGAARVVVQDAVSGQVLLDRVWPLWNEDDDVWRDEDGFVDSWALAADVFVNAGQVFTVTFLATAMVDDSGTDYVFGYSLAKANLQMRVPFVVVEMGP